jgi:hypothetical protein
MKMFIVGKVNLNRQNKTLLKDKEGIFSHRTKVKIPVEIMSIAKLSRNLVNVRVGMTKIIIFLQESIL